MLIWLGGRTLNALISGQEGPKGRENDEKGRENKERKKK